MGGSRVHECVDRERSEPAARSHVEPECFIRLSEKRLFFIRLARREADFLAVCVVCGVSRIACLINVAGMLLAPLLTSMPQNAALLLVEPHWLPAEAVRKSDGCGLKDLSGAFHGNLDFERTRRIWPPSSAESERSTRGTMRPLS